MSVAFAAKFAPDQSPPGSTTSGSPPLLATLESWLLAMKYTHIVSSRSFETRCGDDTSCAGWAHGNAGPVPAPVDDALAGQAAMPDDPPAPAPAQAHGHELVFADVVMPSADAQ